MELTHPPALTFSLCFALRVVDSLEVLVVHVAMIPGWVMLGEVVSYVELAWGPDEIELALLILSFIHQ